MQWLPRRIGSLPRHLFSSSTIRRPRPSSSSSWPCSTCLEPHHQNRRQLLTLAIETSCDDTCVAILEKDATGAARLHFNEKITSDNRDFGGIHPLVAIVSHTAHLGPLVEKALRALPEAARDGSVEYGSVLSVDGQPRLKPDFVSVTRGPGMQTNLGVGLHTAKGLAIAWGVPLMAVNHMQAHAITPRLVSALDKKKADSGPDTESAPESASKRPQFPFFSLLVSGGHTMLVHSRSLNNHGILANSKNIAIGDMLDKCARMILPPEILSADSAAGMYGPLFEDFAFPGSKDSTSYEYNYTPPTRRGDEIAPLDLGFGWALTPPLYAGGTGPVAAATYDVSGLNGQVQSIMAARQDMSVDERRILAQATLRIAFEHLASRVLLALQNLEKDPAQKGTINTLVLSGGVASNKFLRHIMQATLRARGFAHVELTAPPVPLCTDNAAMIAWTAMEMYEEGWRSDLGVNCLRRWSLDPEAEGGGILGASGWYRASKTV
ncbi:glycoprotease family-domain-containing protein [Xylaria nigripes]|nr:glycoprotease family-domain-containing protein [Xylaria nigripes]